MQTGAMITTGSNYPCVVCGGAGTIIRNSPDPRVKCTKCNFTYDASESKKAQDQGNIPDEPPQLQDPSPPTTQVSRSTRIDTGAQGNATTVHQSTQVPRTPAYVFLSKDRSQQEFCTRKSLKKTVLSWESRGLSFDVYELEPRKVSAKVDIQ